MIFEVPQDGWVVESWGRSVSEDIKQAVHEMAANRNAFDRLQAIAENIVANDGELVPKPEDCG
jgi:hypothetical protein